MNYQNLRKKLDVLRRMKAGASLEKYWDHYRFFGEESTIFLTLAPYVELEPNGWQYVIAEEGEALLRHYDHLKPADGIPSLKWFKKWGDRIGVENLHELPEEERCWVIKSSKIRVNGCLVSPSSFFYILKFGEFDRQPRILNGCGTKGCVNPLHQKVVTIPSAQARKLMRIRRAAAGYGDLRTTILQGVPSEIEITDQDLEDVRKHIDDPAPILERIFDGTGYQWTFLSKSEFIAETIRVFDQYKCENFDELYERLKWFQTPYALAYCIDEIGGNIKEKCGNAELLY